MFVSACVCIFGCMLPVEIKRDKRIALWASPVPTQHLLSFCSMNRRRKVLKCYKVLVKGQGKVVGSIFLILSPLGLELFFFNSASTVVGSRPRRKLPG